jgi:cytidine deaminase
MREAERARRRAYAPYSRFRVGAALLTADGTVVHGCNVENASFGLSVCAERNAVWKALSDGHERFVAIAVTARDGHGAPPCGSCRQVLQEFAPRAMVYWRDARGRILRRRLDALLPAAFVLRARGRR